MTHYFDLKTNLGWNRNAENYLKEKNGFIEKLKGRDAWIKDKLTKSIKNITISKNIKCHMVVVFGGNINKTLMNNNVQVATNLENINLDVLHNKRKEENSSYINYGAFENIYNVLPIKK